MKRTLFLLTVFIFGFSASANAQEYEKLFAEGMQHYAEGQHQEALAFLYQAYAHKQTSSSLGLIIRTHDFMGHCTAADRQRELFKSNFPTKRVPNPQQCEKKGTLSITCDRRGFVMVNNTLQLECGASMELPVGTVAIRGASKSLIHVSVVSNGKTKIDIMEPIEKLPLDYEMTLKPVAEKDKERAPRLRVWVRTHLRDDPDMNSKSDVPGFEVYQDAEGIFHVFSDRLMPVHSKSTESKSSDSGR